MEEAGLGVELRGLLQVGGRGGGGLENGGWGWSCAACCRWGEGGAAAFIPLTQVCCFVAPPPAQVDHNMARGPKGWRLLTLYAELKAGDTGADAKTLPDFESAGACWVGAEELKGLPLR